MKMIIFVLLFLSSHGLFAQDESINDTNRGVEENEQLPDEISAEPQEESKTTKKTDKQVISVECKCPENNVQEQEAESAVNSLFPPNSVFLIAPDAGLNSVPPEAQKETELEEKIPGYVEKLPQGYNDESYKQIPTE